MKELSSYGRLCTEFYDLDKPSAPEDALEFYRRIHDQVGGPALEAMCGSGRFLLPFLRLGADIDGVDASHEMLAACRRRMQAEGFEAALAHQRLEELDLPRRYRLIFIPSGSFCLIEEENAVRGGLRRLRRHLEPGGHLVVEVLTPDPVSDADPADTPPVRRVRRPDGAEIVLTSLAPGVSRYELIRDGEVLDTEEERLNCRLYEPADFEKRLVDAGFVGVLAHRAFDEEQPRPADRLVIFRATSPRSRTSEQPSA